MRRGIFQSHGRELSVLTLVLLGVVSIFPRIGEPVPLRGGTDALFYRARVYEIRGTNDDAALRRAFTSTTAQRVAKLAPQLRNPAWDRFSAQFYRRRLLVPAIAAAMGSADAGRAMLYASLLGYLTIGPLLLVLLRRRFPPWISLVVAAAVIFAPPVRAWGTAAMTDSWGVAFEIAALLTAFSAFAGRRRWLVLWFVTMAFMSVTRDMTPVLIVGVAWVAIRMRSRVHFAVLACGVIASVPALLLLGAPLVKQLAWEMQGYMIPHPDGLSWVVHHYPSKILSVLRADSVYPGELSYHLLWYAAGLAVIIATVFFLVAAPRDDEFFMLHRAALFGAVVTFGLAAAYTHMRVELAFVPPVAVALAFAIEQVAYRRNLISRMSDRGGGPRPSYSAPVQR